MRAAIGAPSTPEGDQVVTHGLVEQVGLRFHERADAVDVSDEQSMDERKDVRVGTEAAGVQAPGEPTAGGRVEDPWREIEARPAVLAKPPNRLAP
jgi:hypothetical protein